jgi:hypothetical protein
MPYVTCAETQAYLTEAKTPTVQSPADARTAILAYVGSANKSIEQAAVYRRRACSAELTETDGGLDMLYREMQMHLVSMARVAGEAVRYIREIAEVEKQIKATNKQIRDRCAELNATQGATYVL